MNKQFLKKQNSIFIFLFVILVFAISALESKAESPFDNMATCPVDLDKIVPASLIVTNSICGELQNVTTPENACPVGSILQFATSDAFNTYSNDIPDYDPGALLLYPDGKKDRIGDPLRDLSSLLPTIFSDAGSLTDKLQNLKLKNKLSKLSIEEIFQQESKSTQLILTEEYGFSQKMISRFFKPFFSGIFLEKELSTDL